jgi:hypothetical protein
MTFSFELFRRTTGGDRYQRVGWFNNKRYRVYRHFDTLKETLSAHVVLHVFAGDAGKRPGTFEIDMGLVCSVLHGDLTNTHELPKLTALFVKDF